MARETELKYFLRSFDELRQALTASGALLEGQGFEENIVFDTPDRTLRQGNILLRLRRDQKVRLTLKRPPDEPGPEGFKTWEEVETLVGDFEAMRGVLAGLGFVESFRYEKARETWRLENVLVCLDRLPFGLFVELEGGEDDILRAGGLLGLNREKATAKTYHDLHCEDRAARGLPPDPNFTFCQEDRKSLLRELERARS